MRNIILSITLIVTFSFNVIAGEKISEKEYHFKGKKAYLEVESNRSGTDIFLNIKTRKNLSYSTPGENLFPKMFINENNFSVTWINYRKDDVKLSFFDSVNGIGRILVSEKFEFISSETSIIYNGARPEMIIFRGVKNVDNEDLFIHNIDSGMTKRVSSTPGDENRIIVKNNDIRGRSSFELSTQTLGFKYLYRINIDNMKSTLLKKEEIIRGQGNKRVAFSDAELNTITGFGDSITWGKMRMNDLFDTFNPELTYWAKASDYFNENYGTTYTINLGVNKDTSLKGVERMDDDLLYEQGYFFLVLFGTNDVTSGIFSSTSTTNNIRWILENARDNYKMYPIVSTVPPQKLYLSGVQFYTEQTEKLNKKIELMANTNNFPYIDTYKEFFDHPSGWEAMLEDIKGNHPSPAGHQVMADLVTPIILDLIPQVPSNINFSANTGGNSFSVSCSKNPEFDFSHYNVKFGFSSSDLDREMTYSSNSFTVYFYPFNLPLKQVVYFKIQSVDKDGNKSDFTDIFSVLLN